MNPFSCVVIGNESLVIGCAETLLDRGHDLRAVISDDPGVQGWAHKRGLPLMSDMAELSARFESGAYDWLFSIANLKVIPDPVLKLAARGTINFHDGPLPHYAGLNTPVWALINREPRHGITWHLVESGIDTGDILESATFEIDADETAFSLNSKCYGAAMDSFARLVGQIETGTMSRTPQDATRRGYFGKADRPAAAGRLDFTRPAEALAALVRALDHGGYWNPLTCPKIDLGGRIALVGKATADAAHSSTPGTVLAVKTDALLVAAGDGTALRLSNLTDPFGAPLDPAEHVSLGQHLTSPDAQAAETLAAVLRATTRGEAWWRRALRDMHPAELPLALPARGAEDWTSLTVARPGTADPVTALLDWALLSTGHEVVDLAVCNGEMAETAARWPGYVCSWVPLQARRGESGAQIDQCLDRMQRLGGFAADLIARDPDLTRMRTPDIGLTCGLSMPIPGTAITVSVQADAPLTLHYDRARVTDDVAGLLAERLGDMLADHGRGAVLPARERARTLATANQSARDYDRTLTLHAAIEAQVARTPDAIALVFEESELSYCDMNSRANALAARLIDMGVRPGCHVGIYLRRTPDLVIAALAVLKAGGAYVPLDPAYPADRIAHFISDSQARVIVTSQALDATLPQGSAQRLDIASVQGARADNVDGGATADDLAYLIYTSGSTGTPKGVMVEHRNVSNFCAGMDDRIARAEDGAVWLAVTSLSFDISVLELFYTLARGFKVVLAGDDNRAAVSGGPITVSDQRIDFNLFYWGNDDGPGPRKYELLLEGAKFADANGFNAVWTPERHFHAFGGPYPNPSVTGAAVAAVTKTLSVRAGSCVAPLHHPARIAEEWAVIDNLTGGRAGLAIASGWQPDDFVLRPENTPPANKPAMFDSIDKLRRLWRGEAVEFPTQSGTMFPVVTQPRPVSAELPVWVTTAGNPDTWREAGSIGANVLTHLLGQSIDEVGDKIRIYHAALREAGHNPDDFTVTLMLHTYLAESREKAAEIAREPMKSYLRSAAGLIKQYAWAFPAFKRPAGVSNPFEVDLGSLGEDEMEAILDFAFERYFEDSGLFGTIDDAVARAEQLKRIGVTEIACLIDYGIAPEVVLEGLKPLAEVLRRANAPTELAADDFSLAAQIVRHKVTHLQCTPSMARIIAMNDEARTALRGLRHLMLGGEALPADLVQDLRGCTHAQIQNMYGPTETTIWSTTAPVANTVTGVAPIGTPIANTSVYVLDAARNLVAIGVAGELWIGGEGVTRGYWQQPALTDDRFCPDPFAAESGLTVTAAPRMYRTGDLVRWREDGAMEFLGRADHQVKIRGQRIELGEIESCLGRFAGITGAVVVARDRGQGDVRLVAYVTASGGISEPALRTHLTRHLPEVMVPADIVTLDRFPLTPNKKIDRKALPEPNAKRAAEPVATAAAPVTGVEAGIAAIWSRILGVAAVRADDNFFALGGHSLLAVQAHREIRDTLSLPKLSITDIFRFPTLSALAAHIGKDQPAIAPEPVVDAPERVETMSRRRAMRAGRQERAG